MDLQAISDHSPDLLSALRRYPEIFRKSLSSDNRMCLSSFMFAEYDDLPGLVKKEVQAFADVNVAWLSKHLSAAGVVDPDESEARARAIYSTLQPSLAPGVVTRSHGAERSAATSTVARRRSDLTAAVRGR